MLRVFLLSRDLSMILCDPFASNTLVLSTVRNLQELLSQDALPRVRHSMLSFVVLCSFYPFLYSVNAMGKPTATTEEIFLWELTGQSRPDAAAQNAVSWSRGLGYD